METNKIYMRKQLTVWIIVRKSDEVIFDDAFETVGKTAYCYPVFKTKKDAQLYIKETFLKFKFGRNIAKVKKSTLPL